jgi:hypothetical protein
MNVVPLNYEEAVRLDEVNGNMLWQDSTCIMVAEAATNAPSDVYIRQALRDVQIELDKTGKVLPTRVMTPMTAGYRPEIDGTPELDSMKASHYREVIGILRWIVKLGRIDILVDVEMLSRHAAAPREGHLDQAFHVFAYLKHALYLDEKEADASFKLLDLVETVGIPSDLVSDNAKEESMIEPYSHWQNRAEAGIKHVKRGIDRTLQPTLPEPRGIPVTVHAFVDASHAGRKSQTGVLITEDEVPILWSRESSDIAHGD